MSPTLWGGRPDEFGMVVDGVTLPVLFDMVPEVVSEWVVIYLFIW